MGKKQRNRQIAEVAQQLADAAGPVPTSLLRPPGVVITKPEDLGEADLLPYAKADRTPAGPLQMLEAFTAVQLALDPDRIISMWGQICERGTVVAFRITTSPGRDETTGYAVASFEPGAPEAGLPVDLATARAHIGEHGGRFRIAERASEAGTLAAYMRRIGELS